MSSPEEDLVYLLRKPACVGSSISVDHSVDIPLCAGGRGRYHLQATGSLRLVTIHYYPQDATLEMLESKETATPGVSRSFALRRPSRVALDDIRVGGDVLVGRRREALACTWGRTLDCAGFCFCATAVYRGHFLRALPLFFSFFVLFFALVYVARSNRRPLWHRHASVHAPCAMYLSL